MHADVCRRPQAPAAGFPAARQRQEAPGDARKRPETPGGARIHRRTQGVPGVARSRLEPLKAVRRRPQQRSGGLAVLGSRTGLKVGTVLRFWFLNHGRDDSFTFSSRWPLESTPVSHACSLQAWSRRQFRWFECLDFGIDDSFTLRVAGRWNRRQRRMFDPFKRGVDDSDPFSSPWAFCRRPGVPAARQRSAGMVLERLPNRLRFGHRLCRGTGLGIGYSATSSSSRALEAATVLHLLVPSHCNRRQC